MIFNKIKQFINNLFNNKKTSASGKLTTTVTPGKNSESPTPTKTPASTNRISKIETKNKPTSNRSIAVAKTPLPTPDLNKKDTPIKSTKKKSVKKKSTKRRKK